MRSQGKYIVSDDRKFIYFVTQKVACTSIKNALLPMFDIDTTEYERTRPDGTPALRIHKLFDAADNQIKKEQLVAKLDDQFRGYFKFAFVRNPWDRLLSCYFNKFGRANAPGLDTPAGSDVELYAGMPFAEFVEAVHEIPDDEANPHFRSQHTVICGPQGRNMADFVGRFENLTADFEVVTERIGVAQEIRLPHLLRSGIRKSRPYTDFYDDRLKNLVHRRYQEDIEVFGYSY